MAYYTKDSGVYHKYQKCHLGNNIEADKKRTGTGGKKLCQNCEEIGKGNRTR